MSDEKKQLLNDVKAFIKKELAEPNPTGNQFTIPIGDKSIDTTKWIDAKKIALSDVSPTLQEMLKLDIPGGISIKLVIERE